MSTHKSHRDIFEEHIVLHTGMVQEAVKGFYNRAVIIDRDVLYNNVEPEKAKNMAFESNELKAAIFKICGFDWDKYLNKTKYGN